MEKTIHVNSYVKRDGTQVREHYRTIDSFFAPETIDYLMDKDQNSNDIKIPLK